MAPKRMRSKFEKSQCYFCEIPILENDHIFYAKELGAWHVEHGANGQIRDVPILHGNAPPASSNREEPKPVVGPVASSVLPAAVPSEDGGPIYTYHRRVTTGPGSNDWAEWGVSTKGRTISMIEQESVDNLIRSAIKGRNEWGEVVKDE